MAQDLMETTRRVGRVSAIFIAVSTLVTFAFAMAAVPPAGPYCPENCLSYPYLESLRQFPRDYIWMMLASVQIAGYVVFMVALHHASPPEKKIFSHIGMIFAAMAATVLLSDYFVQFSVVPISLKMNETEGIALLTQYNGHGVFIALEEVGFWLMSLSLFFLSFIFDLRKKGERALRWILPVPAILCVAAFAFYTAVYGLDRSYRFEVFAISANWLTLILVGFLAERFLAR